MWARFFLVGSRTDLRLKMGLLGVVLGVYQVWCRNSHFQWSKLDLENTPNLRIFQKLRLCTKSWCIFFWLGSEGIGCFKHVSQGYICTCEIFLHKMAVLVPKKDSEDLQFEIFFNFFLQILGAFFSGRVQNAFQTQNGFTWNIFRGMPSSVPRLTFFKDF